jgi:hypothetical protein
MDCGRWRCVIAVMWNDNDGGVGVVQEAYKA